MTLCLQMTHARHQTIASPIANYSMQVRYLLYRQWYIYTYVDYQSGCNHPGLLGKCTFKGHEVVLPVVGRREKAIVCLCK